MWRLNVLMNWMNVWMNWMNVWMNWVNVLEWTEVPIIATTFQFLNSYAWDFFFIVNDRRFKQSSRN